MTLSNLTALSSFTDKAPVSPTYMNAKFAEIQANLDALSSSASTFAARTAVGWFNVKEYGATGNGTTDDTAAIRLAVTAACAAGGTVYFPTGAGERYSITSDLRVSSTFPVHLVMDPGHQRHDAYADSDHVGLVLGSDMSYPIYYTLPSDRDNAGGGSIRGVTITDATDRGYAVEAAIYLKDANVGFVAEDLTVRHVRGRALLTEAMIQGTISRPHIAYCGTTDKPAVQLGEATSNTYVTQATHLLDGRIEVCSGSTYVVLATPNTVGGNQGSNSVAFCQFESDSQASTEWPYVDVDHHKSRVVNCGFNRNKANHVTFRSNNGTDGLLANCIFDGDTSANTVRVQVDGQRIIINNLLLRGATSGTSAQVFVTGNQCNVANVSIQRGGNVRITGQLCSVSNLNLSNLDSGRAAAIELGENTVLGASEVWFSAKTTYPSISTAGLSLWHYDTVWVYNTAETGTNNAALLRSTLAPVAAGYGSQAAPSFTFRSEESVGFYRSGVSTVAMSTGTFNLATNAVRLSMRTLAASALTVSAANTNVAVNEVVLTIGGASGASLAVHSGGTVYIFNSALSAKAT